MAVDRSARPSAGSRRLGACPRRAGRDLLGPSSGSRASTRRRRPATASCGPRRPWRPILVDVGRRLRDPRAGARSGIGVARLRGDGTGGEPLLLLSHLDVVPAPPELWTHDPFGGDVADGYVWGRGAVDMKGMVAMEVAVVRRLAAEARAAGRDPATDPIPGCGAMSCSPATADEEAGGWPVPAGWSTTAPSCCRRPAPSTSAAVCRSTSAAGGSIRSASPRRATPTTGSWSTARGATARCRVPTTPRSAPPPS